MANMQTITLGGGCFWCIEAVYKRIDGVKEAISGYAGGTTVDPSYEAVCSGRTGHAEVVEIHYDADRVTTREVIDLFFRAHDPTQLNRQGADVGTQYRSVLFYHSDEQREIAEELKQGTENALGRPVVTNIAAVPTFYRAEDYHQDYFDKHPGQPYCAAVIRPKLQKLNMF